ncbi:hypothetical protein BKA80DRAFT_30875 [Phyllosticta citrichinensis]
MDLTLVGSEPTVNRTLLQGLNTGICQPRIWPVESATVALLVNTSVRSQEMDTLFCLVQWMELTTANGKPCRVPTLVRRGIFPWITYMLTENLVRRKYNRRSPIHTSTGRRRMEPHMQSFQPVGSGIRCRIASTSLRPCDLTEQCDLIELERHKKLLPSSSSSSSSSSIPNDTTDPEN